MPDKTDSPWEAGVAGQAEKTREEQHKALTAEVIRTLGMGIYEILGRDCAAEEYWREATIILARVVGGLPEDVKVRFYQSVIDVFIKQVVTKHPEIKTDVDMAMTLLNRRRNR